MRENVRVKSVHFNIKTDEELLKALGKRNFSKYIKRLIKEDIQRKKELPKQSSEGSGEIKFTLKE